MLIVTIKCIEVTKRSKIEVIIIWWLLFSGFKAISMLGTLGTVKTKKVVWDASEGVYVASGGKEVFFLNI